MTINDIKKTIREIEISYDYNHSKNDYDIVLNLTELANLIKTLQGKAIDDFADKIISLCDDGEFMNRFNEFTATTILELAEQLKAGGIDETI